MSFRAPLTLLDGAIHRVEAFGERVTCRVINAPEVTPEQGARCAREMHGVLAEHVFVEGSRYRELVFDLRRGPEVFGPKTRAELERLFALAERSQMAVVVWVRDSAMQRLQFGALQRECAPTGMRVVADAREIEAWFDTARERRAARPFDSSAPAPSRP